LAFRRESPKSQTYKVDNTINRGKNLHICPRKQINPSHSPAPIKKKKKTNQKKFLTTHHKKKKKKKQINKNKKNPQKKKK